MAGGHPIGQHGFRLQFLWHPRSARGALPCATTVFCVYPDHMTYCTVVFACLLVSIFHQALGFLTIRTLSYSPLYFSIQPSWPRLFVWIRLHAWTATISSGPSKNYRTWSLPCSWTLLLLPPSPCSQWLLEGPMFALTSGPPQYYVLCAWKGLSPGEPMNFC